VLQGLSIFGKHQAQRRAARENRRAALENLKLTVGDLNARATQEAAAATQAKLTIEQDAGMLEGQTATSAAAGNVSGQTVDSLLRDVVMQEGQAKSTIDANLGYALGQIERGKRGAAAAANAQINQVQAPSWGSLALGLAGVGLNAYTGYRYGA
jgi:hypothetical protein